MISAEQVAESSITSQGNQDRVAALTDEVANMVASQLDTAPAGCVPVLLNVLK